FLLVIFNSVVANTIRTIVNTFYGKTTSGVIVLSVEDETSASSEEFSFSHFVDFFGENTWLNRFIVDTSISFFFIAVMFLIGLIFYRYHLIGGFSFLAIGLFILIFAIAKGWVWDFLVNVYTDFSIVFFYQMFVTGIGL